MHKLYPKFSRQHSQVLIGKILIYWLLIAGNGVMLDLTVEVEADGSTEVHYEMKITKRDEA